MQFKNLMELNSDVRRGAVMKSKPNIRLLCLIFAICLAGSSCATRREMLPEKPITLRVDGHFVSVNQGDKSLPQEKFGIKYDCTVDYERQIESKGRVEKIKEEVSLGWEVNQLDEGQEWIKFRLYVSNPAKIVHRVTYFQKVDGKAVQEYAEPSDSIADYRNHFCRFPVLKNSKVVEFGARVDLYDEKKTVYATLIADGFRYRAGEMSQAASTAQKRKEVNK